jgi:leucyl aminopeptidase
MEFTATNTSSLNWSGDILALGLFEDQIELTGDLSTLDDKLAGTLKELITETEFKGKADRSISTRVGGNSPIRKVILVGLGKSDALKLDSLRRAAANIAKTAKSLKGKSLGVSLPIFETPETTAQAITEGIELALYQDPRFKS